MGIGKILNINNALESEIEKGGNITQIMEKWDALQINVALYINSETPGIPPTLAPAKPTRGILFNSVKQTSKLLISVTIP